MSESRTSTAFAPIRWTLVLRDRGSAPEAQRALGELCEAYYWQPVFRFLRREGRDDDTARELTQEFFARLLAKPGLGGVEPGRGRFRAYLSGAVKHFLAGERDRVNAAKRGGGHAPLSLDAQSGTDTASELPVPDPSGMAPDAFFDRQWAVATVDRAVAALSAAASAPIRCCAVPTAGGRRRSGGRSSHAARRGAPSSDEPGFDSEMAAGCTVRTRPAR